MAYDYAVRVVVPAGKVTSDLTNFVVRLKLDDLPVNWWDGTTDDLGNIRVRTAAGAEIPFDLVTYNRAARTGELYFKSTLLTAVQNDFYVHTLSGVTTPPAATDANGSYAVWSDYDAVFMAGAGGALSGMVNRVNGGAVSITGTTARLGYRPGAVGNYSAAGATDEIGLNDNADVLYLARGDVISGGFANTLRRYDVASGTTTASNTTIFSDVGVTSGTSRNIGGITVRGDEVFVSMSALYNSNWWYYIGVFDATTLVYKRSYFLGNPTTAFGGTAPQNLARITWDHEHNEWLLEHSPTAPVRRYDDNWTYLGGYTKVGFGGGSTSFSLARLAGNVVMGYTSGKGVYRAVIDQTAATITYTYVTDALAATWGQTWQYRPTTGKLFSAQSTTVRTWIPEDRMLTLGGATWFKYVGVPKRTSAWTVGVSHYAWDATGNNTLISYGDDSTNDAPRATLFTGPNGLSMYSSSNTLAEAAGAGPAYGTLVRSHHYYDLPSLVRRAFREGTQKLSQAITSTTYRPSSTAVGNTVFVGIEDLTAASPLRATLDRIYLRNGALDTAWMTAEAASWNSPTTFYEVVAPTDLGIATESTSVEPLAQVVYLGLPLETDDIPGNVQHSSPLGTTVETDSTFALPTVKQLGQASETDSVSAATVVVLTPITVNLGQVSETDSALAPIPPAPQTITFLQPRETDTALAAVVKTPYVYLGQAKETDYGLTASPKKPYQLIKLLGYATERDSVLTQAKITYNLRQAIEYDSGLAAFPNLDHAIFLGQAVENTITYEVVGQTLIRWWDGQAEQSAVLVGYWDGRQIRLAETEFTGLWNGVEVVDLFGAPR